MVTQSFCQNEDLNASSAVGTHAPCQRARSPLIPPSAAGTVHNAVRTAEGGGGLCLRAAAALLSLTVVSTQ